MGYNYDTGHCDEVCDNCTYITCIEHPHHNQHNSHELKYNVTCKICGEQFDQEYYRQAVCENCRVVWDEQQEEKVSASIWIKHRGYKNKTEFIKDWGEETWKSIQ